jgi:hypothetical protein
LPDYDIDLIAAPAPCGFCDEIACAGHELVDVRAPSAFWSALSPAQALALLKAAPKVAGPYVEQHNDRTWTGEPMRLVHTAIGPLDAAKVGAVGPSAKRFYWSAHVGATIYDEDVWGYCATLDEAKAAADNALKAAGWVLVEAEDKKEGA